MSKQIDVFIGLKLGQYGIRPPIKIVPFVYDICLTRRHILYICVTD